MKTNESNVNDTGHSEYSGHLVSSCSSDSETRLANGSVSSCPVAGSWDETAVRGYRGGTGAQNPHGYWDVY